MAANDAVGGADDDDGGGGASSGRSLLFSSDARLRLSLRPEESLSCV